MHFKMYAKWQPFSSDLNVLTALWLFLPLWTTVFDCSSTLCPLQVLKEVADDAEAALQLVRIHLMMEDSKKARQVGNGYFSILTF